jgi:RNA polymerase sigma factor (sigma-70 family)
MTIKEFNSCVDQHADGVYRFILKNIKDEDKAHDVVQDVFTKMWEKVADINYLKSKSYLFSAAYHTMIDTIRRDKKQVQMEDYHLNGSYEQKHYTGAKQIIQDALERLPDSQRTVVMLRDYEGYSYQEIGEITGLNEAQVKVYIYRARLTLKNYLVKPENVI